MEQDGATRVQVLERVAEQAAQLARGLEVRCDSEGNQRVFFRRPHCVIADALAALTEALEQAAAR